MELTPEVQGTLYTWGMMIVALLVMYLLLIRPQKKREKEAAAMRNSLEVGDEIVTIGGIVGTVVSLREDTLLIETGSDRNKIRIMRSAVSSNNTAVERVAANSSAKRSAKK